jgi:hypothetical protein
MLIYIYCRTKAHITAAGRETTSPMPSWTQMWEDPAAATTRQSEFWVVTRQFLYFIFVTILVTHLCMTCDEFWTIVLLYVELSWIVVDCARIGSTKKWTYGLRGHGLAAMSTTSMLICETDERNTLYWLVSHHRRTYNTFIGTNKYMPYVRRPYS